MVNLCNIIIKIESKTSNQVIKVVLLCNILFSSLCGVI